MNSVNYQGVEAAKLAMNESRTAIAKALQYLHREAADEGLQHLADAIACAVLAAEEERRGIATLMV